MVTPETLDGRFTLLTAAARYDALRVRDALASPAALGAQEEDDEAGDYGAPSLSPQEALEMLALGEVIARKAGYGRQLGVRSARAAGASWSQIGAALGVSKQAAWETHGRWIDDQAEQHRRSGYQGLDADQVAAARALAGRCEGEDAGAAPA
ncbi:hypothetical protein [Sphaerisporangium dianthi]|uniref:Uncharacterized protein n=1 Tax=Sphaerisporangium dianthi TaxID=1436120 RepID=A0ABV9CTN1_9ACTN